MAAVGTPEPNSQTDKTPNAQKPPNDITHPVVVINLNNKTNHTNTQVAADGTPQPNLKHSTKRKTSAKTTTRQSKAAVGTPVPSMDECLCLNADVLSNKLTELQTIIRLHTPKYVGISEVIPKNFKDFDIDNYRIDGYTLETNITKDNVHDIRGCIMYIKHGVDYKLYDFPNELQGLEEHVTILVNLKGKDKLLCSTLYRRGASTTENNKILLKFIKHVALVESFSHLVLMGDINLKNIDWENMFCSIDNPDDYSNQFLDTLRDAFLFQHVTEPTRQRGGDEPSLLDIIITNEEGTIQNLEYLAPLGKSDHSILKFSIACEAPYNPPKIKIQYDKGDYKSMLKSLQEIDWISEFSKYPDSVQKQWEFFKQKYHETEKTYVPRKNVFINGKMSKKLSTPLDAKSISKIKKKNKLWGKIRKNLATLEEELHFKQLRNQIRSLTRKSKKLIEKKVAKNAKSNPKAFWAYAQSKLKTRAGIPDLVKPGTEKSPEFSKNDVEKADIFLSYFSSVFTEEPSDGGMPAFENRNYKEALLNLEITDEMIKKKLLKLKTNKSPGPDRIHPRVLHEVAEGILTPLRIIFNTSLRTETLPQEWKHANVTAIYKKGQRTLPNNYRPVSLTCILCKVMESIIRDAVIAHFKENNLFSPKQFGFISQRSTVLQLLHVLDIWTEILDEGGSFEVIYCDFMKAFDKVPHKRLVYKVQKYGIQGNILGWINSFLNNRTQCVVINDHVTKNAPVTSGIPQGSVLGPLLFVIYINDLAEAVDDMTHIFLFADDTKAFRNIYNSTQSDILQEDINKLLKWSDDWLLKFHPDKCVSMSFGPGEPNTYWMNDTKLKQSHCEKDLGINIDDQLNFKKHISIIVNKATRIMAVVRKTFDYMDEDIFKLIFKSLIRPHLEYGAPVWSPHHKYLIEQIEKVQRRATKTVPGLKDLSYEDRLRKLKLPTLIYRRVRGDMITVFKFFNEKHGYDPTLPSILPLHSEVIKESKTRGHKFKLHVDWGTKDVRKFSFSMRVREIWNSLPPEVVESEDIKSFESALDKFWEGRDLVYNWEALHIAIHSDS